MRTMKDSCVEWLGEVPEGWDVAPVKRVAFLQHGSDPQLEGDIPVYGSGSAPFKTCGEYKEGPTVLLGRKGTLDCPQYLEGRYWNVDTAFNVVMRSDAMAIKYFFYAICSVDSGDLSTNTAKPSMTQGAWYSIKLPMPPVDEQARIVEFLDSRCDEIDCAVSVAEQSIQECKAYQETFIACQVLGTGGRRVKLSYFADSVLGKMLDQSQQRGINVHRYLANRDVQWFRLDTSNLSEMDFPEDSFERYEIKDGDILACEGGEVGRCAVYRGESPDFYFQKAVHRIRVDQAVAYPEFVVYQMFSKAKTGNFMEVRKGQATFNHLTGEQLKQLRFVLPSVDEQRRIAAYLDTKCTEIDHIVEAKQAIIDELKAYKQSLIYEAVTGKLEV